MKLSLTTRALLSAGKPSRRGPCAVDVGAMLLAAIGLVGCGGGGGDEAAPVATYTPAHDVVTVTGGQMSAAADSTAALRVFKALPFAAPPVGALRWKAPQPVIPWTFVKRSDEFSAACIQGVGPAGAIGAILYNLTEALPF